MTKQIDLSLVIPVYFEEECIPQFIKETVLELEKLDLNYEIIFIDDGSLDRTVDLINQEISKNHNIKLIEFSHNHGKQAAVTAGIHHSKGDFLLYMDSDLQDPPYEISRFLEEIKKGYNIVYGIRKNKIDGFLNRWFSRMFWFLLDRFTGLEIPKRLAVMRIFDRTFATEFGKYKEQNRFIEGIFFRIGLKKQYLSIDQNPRFAGKTKFSFRKKIDLALTAILDFSELPLLAITRLGFLLSFLGFVVLLAILVAKLFFVDFRAGWPSLIGGLTLAFGLQMSFTGILALYISKIYKEVKNRPLYSILQKTGFDD